MEVDGLIGDFDDVDGLDDDVDQLVGEVGVQLGAGPAQEHLLIALGALIEQEMPWADRVPPLHVSRLAG